MSAPILPHGEHVEAMRAYHLRLAEWLGIDPSLAFDLRDEDVPCGEPPLSYLMTTVRWKSADRPLSIKASAGRAEMALCFQADGETVVFTNGVSLDGMETERMREAVGQRPDMFTPEQRLMLDGLQWRREHT